MNVRLSTELSLFASIHWMDSVTNNLYSIGLGLMTNTEDNLEQNVAMGRIRAYIQDVLHSSIMIDQQFVDDIKMFNAMGFKTTTLPEQPFDQSVAIMLYCKLNAICEDRMTITDITLSSTLGDSVRYHFDAEDAFGPFAEDGWWHESDPSWCEHTSENPSGKVLKMDRKLTWSDLGLSWDGETPQGEGNVVVGKFGKKE